MDSIRIETGEKRIAINNDPSRVIVFNPTDIAFAERFYGLMKDLEVKESEYQERSSKLENDPAVDGHGLPRNIADGIAMLRDVCEFMRDRVDHVFGRGTSQIVFGDAMNLEMFAQFFEGITPYVQAARSSKLAKYNRKQTRRVMK